MKYQISPRQQEINFTLKTLKLRYVWKIVSYNNKEELVPANLKNVNPFYINIVFRLKKFMKKWQKHSIVHIKNENPMYKYR